MAVSSGVPGRTATKAMNGLNTDGYKSRSLSVMQLDFATAEDYQQIREELTSEEARRVLDAFVKQEEEGRVWGRGRYFTKKDLRELRALCEAEGNCLIYDHQVARLRDAGEPVPIMLTIKQSEAETVQAYGAGGMAKRSAEEARLSRNALGLNKQARAKMVEDIKQMSLWDQEDGELNPEQMTPEQIEKELSEKHGIVVEIASRRNLG